MITRDRRLRDFESSLAICSVCAGEGFVPVIAVTTGEQTAYTLQCPHCLGFGKTQNVKEFDDVSR